MGMRDYTAMVGISCRDFGHEAKLSICSIIGIAAVLTPLLVLFGLKFGVISSMLKQLTEDPHVLAVQPIGQGRYGDDWFRDLGREPGVGFLIPNTRFLAATVFLANDAADLSADAEFLPSGDHDPLLPDDFRWPDAALAADQPEPVVIAESTASKLHAQAGTILDGKLGRTVDGTPESVHVKLKVIGILPAARFERDGLLVRLPFLLAAEDYREGFAVPALQWAGKERPATPRSFASFRLYGRTVNDIAPLRAYLLAHGIDSTTQLAEIELVQHLDRDLSALFLVVAGLGSLGYLLSMMMSLWASVVRKQHDLSLLRLIGFSIGAIATFPIVQGLLSALLGAGLASAATLAVAPAVNRLFGSELKAGDQIFRLLPQHFGVATGLTIIFAVLAASYGGLRAARIAPGEGLREE
jgi:putative ABC transport system permease protein